MLLSLLLVVSLSTGCAFYEKKVASDPLDHTKSVVEPIYTSVSNIQAVSSAEIATASPIPTLDQQVQIFTKTVEETLPITPTPASTSIPSPTPDPTMKSPGLQKDTYTGDVLFNLAKLVSNDHLGSDWSTTVEVDGQRLGKGKSIPFQRDSGETIKVICTAIEDDKVADIGTETLSVDVSKLKKGINTFNVNVTVVEKGGKYSGNTARWVFTIEITRR